MTQVITPITYRQLAASIHHMPAHQQDCDVTFLHADAYWGALQLAYADVRTAVGKLDDQLDTWHPYLVQHAPEVHDFES